MVAKEYCQNKVFVEEYQKKMDDDKAKANENIKAAEKVKTAENKNQMTKGKEKEKPLMRSHTN